MANKSQKSNREDKKRGRTHSSPAVAPRSESTNVVSTALSSVRISVAKKEDMAPQAHHRSNLTEKVPWAADIRINPGVTTRNQANASARKRWLRKKRAIDDQTEAKKFGITVDELKFRRVQEAMPLIHAERIRQEAARQRRLLELEEERRQRERAAERAREVAARMSSREDNWLAAANQRLW